MSRFDDLYNQLISITQDEFLRGSIEMFRDSEPIQEVRDDEMNHQAVRGSFTWIANAAEEEGESSLADLAREMRDEIDRYIATDEY